MTGFVWRKITKILLIIIVNFLLSNATFLYHMFVDDELFYA